MTEADRSGSAPPPPKGPSWTDLGPRVLSAAVIVAIVATTIYFGGYVFAATVGIAVALTYREWEQMVTLKPLAPLGMVLMGLLVLLALAFPQYGPLGGVAVIVLAVVVAVLFGARDTVVWRIAGIAFFGVVMIAVLAMRGTGPEGIIAGWFLGVVVALNDTGAYFVGRIVGGEKLVPQISPAKTRSGAIGGWVTGTLAGTIFWAVFNSGSPWWIGLLLAAIMGPLGQVGDLSESAIKRRFRVKDSGDIIPGHGGLMDRLDSITFGVLFLFLVGTIHAGINNVATGFLVW